MTRESASGRHRSLIRAGDHDRAGTSIIVSRDGVRVAARDSLIVEELWGMSDGIDSAAAHGIVFRSVVDRESSLRIPNCINAVDGSLTECDRHRRAIVVLLTSSLPSASEPTALSAFILYRTGYEVRVPKKVSRQAVRPVRNWN